jgi:hypothetical protein
MKPETLSHVRVIAATAYALAVLLVLSCVRIVGAEDDCAMGTWSVQPSPAGLLCIWEPVQ